MGSKKELTPERVKELENRIKELTLALEEKQQQLVNAEKMAMLGNLVAGIAHELNTPLGALKSNCELFMQFIERIKNILFSPDAPKAISQNEVLQHLFASIDQLNKVNQTASERLVEIMGSVRRYARQEALEPVEADIHEILDCALSLAHHELKNYVTVHKSYGDLPRIPCFPNKLNQVFLNILINARQAMDKPGDIFITTVSQPDAILIDIKYTVKGIKPELLDRIFEVGFTTKPDGMGVGLSIVKQIIEMHQGRVEVESAEGTGTTFRLILPYPFKKQ